ncbi:MAG: alpha/beta hydrolase [Bacteroidales bacterium]|nr:alpha/beta hydrolase [Bacteroidales bacterium]
MCSCINTSPKEANTTLPIAKPLSNIDSAKLFHYYVPGNFSKNPHRPLLVCIDPQGNGKLPVVLYKNLADEYNFSIVGLNNIQNNQSIFLQEIESAINSARQLIPFDDKNIYLTGFSGGARMSFYFALTQKVSGIVMCGAGPGNLRIDNLDIPIAILTGKNDFNFVESYYPPGSKTTLNKNIISMHFNGGHEWPESSTFDNAIKYLFSKNNVIIDSSNYFVNYQNESYNRNLLEAFKFIELGYKISDDYNRYLNELKLLLKDVDFNDYYDKLHRVLQKEMERNKTLTRSIEEKDIKWWSEETLILLEQIESEKNAMVKSSYQRTLAYLGVMIYGKTNNAVRNNAGPEKIKKFLYIYETLEPENPDVFYLKALYYKNQNDTFLMNKYLKKAQMLGFSNESLYHQDFGV